MSPATNASSWHRAGPWRTHVRAVARVAPCGVARADSKSLRGRNAFGCRFTQHAHVQGRERTPPHRTSHFQCTLLCLQHWRASRERIPFVQKAAEINDLGGHFGWLPDVKDAPGWRQPGRGPGAKFSTCATRRGDGTIEEPKRSASLIATGRLPCCNRPVAHCRYTLLPSPSHFHFSPGQSPSHLNSLPPYPQSESVQP